MATSPFSWLGDVEQVWIKAFAVSRPFSLARTLPATHHTKGGHFDEHLQGKGGRERKVSVPQHNLPVPIRVMQGIMKCHEKGGHRDQHNDDRLKPWVQRQAQAQASQRVSLV
jgi:hypothetical protein